MAVTNGCLLLNDHPSNKPFADDSRASARAKVGRDCHLARARVEFDIDVHLVGSDDDRGRHPMPVAVLLASLILARTFSGWL